MASSGPISASSIPQACPIATLHPISKILWIDVCIIKCCMNNNNCIKASYTTTPSVPNYRSFQKSWRVEPFQSLTKIIERNTKIYDIKYVYYKNITNKEFNDT